MAASRGEDRAEIARRRHRPDDRRVEQRKTERLFDAAHARALEVGREVVPAGIAAHHHARAFALRAADHHAHEVGAVAVGHVNVGQQQADGAGIVVVGLHGLAIGRGGDDDLAAATEVARHFGENVGVVVGHEDAIGGWNHVKTLEAWKVGRARRGRASLPDKRPRITESCWFGAK